MANKQMSLLLNIDDVLAQTASACRGSTEYQSWLRQTMQQRGPVKIGKRATCLEEVTNMLVELGERQAYST